MKQTAVLLILTATLLTSLLLLMGDTGSARTIIVDDDGEGDHTSIQDAVNASEDGDTIQVRSGSYLGNLVLNRSVQLQGSSQISTIIYGDGAGDVVTVTADGAVVSGFLITVAGDVISGTGTGLVVEGDDTIIANTTCSNKSYGIWVRRADNASLTGNTCSLNVKDGILVEASQNISMTNNVCYLNDVAGISLRHSEGAIITNNTLDTNYHYGILLLESFDATLSGNIFEKCSVYLWPGSLDHWNTHSIDTTNLVSGKPVYYLANTGGATVPAGAGQVILVNCTDIMVADQEFDNVTAGVQVGLSSQVTVTNISCSFSWYGIEAIASRELTLSNNRVYLNRRSGIFVVSSSGSAITNNICDGNGATFYTTTTHGRGIHLRASNGNLVSANTCIYGSGVGIYLFNSSGNSISYNFCYYNVEEGIVILQGSQGSIITGNNCTANWVAGIRVLGGSDYATIMNNSCFDNRKGISLEASDYGRLTDNVITGNEIGIYVGSSARNTSARGNIITDSRKKGVDASENNGYPVDARFNSWGTDSGPYHKANNSEGRGDTLAGGVLFEPWLDSEGKERYAPEAEDDGGEGDGVFRLVMVMLSVLFVLLLLWLMMRSVERDRERAEEAKSSPKDEKPV